VFDRLTARLDQLLRRAAKPDPHADAAARRRALIEAKSAVRALQAALTETERELDAERRHLTDAERRGRLAAEVPDPETVALAERFAARHRERIVLLERKVAVQREEVALAEREAAELVAQERTARTTQAPGPGPAASVDAAWRELDAAGVRRPGHTVDGDRDDLDTEAESLAAQADQKLREQAVDAQLAYLKRKMGKRT